MRELSEYQQKLANKMSNDFSYLTGILVSRKIVGEDLSVHHMIYKKLTEIYEEAQLNFKNSQSAFRESGGLDILVERLDEKYKMKNVE